MSKYYVTTAIDYVNAKPHLGTAYEKIGADCLARYKRLAGFDTYFLMGTDEHSTNVEKEAAQLGEDAQAYCDRMAEEFEAVWAKLHISYDQFIRTTDPSHANAVQDIFQKIYDNGYIYTGLYKGLYCVSCEEFVGEKDLVDGKCPRHQQEPEWIEETNYFFALSKFSDRLRNHIETHPEFIQPDIRRNEILNVIKLGLEDVSISRTGKKWGVPLPMAENQVVYVWFDALINYVSALGYAGGSNEKFLRYWPADCHIIGKDITRFHCLIWPAMLMAADITLPKCVFGHGFVYSRGTKMSKTLGNIVDPNEMASFFGADVLRYILLRGIAFNRDGDFTVEQSITRYNAELANELGNLFSRTLSMVQRYRKGEIPEWTSEAGADYNRLTEGMVDQYQVFMDRLAFDEALDAMWKSIQAANRYVEEKKPWELARADDKAALWNTLRALLEVLRTVSVLCVPFMPVKAAEMRGQLGLPDDISAMKLEEARNPGDTGWKKIGAITPLFPKLESPAEE
ncbi:MAG: methionine--tRNA ligase [Candidatus Latescibacteria bacterium]|nr:methionine--tRNA ligase [Candidatus Latescibacterota bacterium]NIM22629.1 methionine--tRNA ligase [Candidatus Latescibacterota bacterium]NIM64918.1 methionine--tRNA ligase [Candidatus Latescibacterota bacterium]NIO01433.1 methionine--tRNA ligase [Candidatus Latescibacterota bacterium]NIO27943.1 methionine--tRNA ligase [Candidatus Latescibacterota bacterium]